MAKRIRTNDAPPHRPAPAIDGMAGGLLSGAMLAGGVAGVVEHGRGAQAAEVTPADPAGTGKAMDDGIGEGQPADRPSPVPGAAAGGPGSPPTMDAAPAQAVPAAALVSNETSPTAQSTTDAPAAPSLGGAPPAPGESIAARSDVTATPSPPASSVAEQAEPAAGPPAVDLAPLPASLASMADQLAGDMTKDAAALTEAVTAEIGSLIVPAAITAELESALEGPTTAVADLGSALDSQLESLPTTAELASALMSPVAEVATLAETVTAIPATLLGAESLEAPLSALSIVLGAEANTAAHLSATEPGMTAEAGVEFSSEVDAGLFDLVDLEGGITSAISFAGLSYLDMPEIDGGTTGGNGGLLHGFI